jgi:preprotein translocase subunit YajC
VTSETLTIILAQQSGGSPLSRLIIVSPMAAILYMTIVPQRKQRQRQADMLRKLDVGDEVVTTGGIVGVITFVEDDLFHLEVDTDVVIRIAKSAVARSTTEPDPAEKPASRSRRATKVADEDEGE